MSLLKLGFNKDIKNQDYHDDREYISSSGLKLLYNDPREFHRKYVLGISDNQSSAALDLGTYVHARILEPETVDAQFAVFSGAIKSGNNWKKFKEENSEKIILSTNQKIEADTLIRNFYDATVMLGDQKHERTVKVSSFFEKGVPEESLCVELDGIKVKTRFDYRREFEDFGSVQDLKTTRDFIPNRKSAEIICARMDYDLSAALYVDSVEKATGKPHDFYFCFLSKANGDIKMFRASKQMLEVGRKKYKEAITLLKEARSTGIYYKNKIEEINSIELT